MLYPPVKTLGRTIPPVPRGLRPWVPLSTARGTAVCRKYATYVGGGEGTAAQFISSLLFSLFPPFPFFSSLLSPFHDGGGEEAAARPITRGGGGRPTAPPPKSAPDDRT